MPTFEQIAINMTASISNLCYFIPVSLFVLILIMITILIFIFLQLPNLKLSLMLVLFFCLVGMADLFSNCSHLLMNSCHTAHSLYSIFYCQYAAKYFECLINIFQVNIYANFKAIMSPHSGLITVPLILIQHRESGKLGTFSRHPVTRKSCILMLYLLN